MKKTPVVISIIMLILAVLLKWPYGYYTLLRLVVCGTAVYMTWFAKTVNREGWMWTTGFVVLLFNPIIPIHLAKDLWIFIDLVVAIIFFIALLRVKKTLKT